MCEVGREGGREREHSNKRKFWQMTHTWLNLEDSVSTRESQEKYGAVYLHDASRVVRFTQTQHIRKLIQKQKVERGMAVAGEKEETLQG